MFIITTVQSVAVQCSEISIYILLDLLLLTVWVEIKKQHSSDALSWVWWQTWIDFKCKECPTNSYSSCKCKYNSVFYILIRLAGWHIDRSRQVWQKINQEMTKQRLLSLSLYLCNWNQTLEYHLSRCSWQWCDRCGVFFTFSHLVSNIFGLNNTLDWSIVTTEIHLTARNHKYTFVFINVN